MPEVYIVTMPDLGWDCVVAVFDAQHTTEEELEKQYPAKDYVIHGETVYKNIEEYPYW